MQRPDEPPFGTSVLKSFPSKIVVETHRQTHTKVHTLGRLLYSATRVVVNTAVVGKNHIHEACVISVNG